jgi:hypothetical protein
LILSKIERDSDQNADANPNLEEVHHATRHVTSRHHGSSHVTTAEAAPSAESISLTFKQLSKLFLVWEKQKDSMGESAPLVPSRGINLNVENESTFMTKKGAEDGLIRKKHL